MANPPNFSKMTCAQKLAWLHTPDGTEYFKQALAEHKTLTRVCKELQIKYRTYPEWRRRTPELARHIALHRGIDPDAEPKLALEETDPYACRPAYRLIYGLDHCNTRGIVGDTADDLDTIWDNIAVKNHFESHNLNPDDYKANCLKALQDKGLYTLSHLRAIAYCRITASGTIVIMQPPIKPQALK